MNMIIIVIELSLEYYLLKCSFPYLNILIFMDWRLGVYPLYLSTIIKEFIFISFKVNPLPIIRLISSLSALYPMLGIILTNGMPIILWSS